MIKLKSTGLFEFSRKLNILLLPLLLITAGALSCSHAKEKPNIVFIMADDLGYGDLGCYGQELICTPNLDEMAKEGMRFTSAYSGSQICAPSRSVLMTGQHTGHTTVRQNNGRVGGEKDEITGRGHRIPLLDDDFTVAEVLKGSGYVTGLTGKWGLGEAGSTGEPNRQGFDEFYGYLNQNHAVYYYTDYLWKNGQRDSIRENRNNKGTKYTHDLLTDFALDFIRRHSKEPFFLYLAYTIPHFNIEVPEIEAYAMNTDWPEQMKILASMITRMDRDVGKIKEELKKLGIEDNTIIFFTSDNGPSYDRRVVGRDSLFNSNGPFKGSKGSLDEGGLRVPMIIVWSGTVPAGTVSDEPWYFADVLPTLADISGCRIRDNIDGISVWPLLKDENYKLPGRFMYWEKPHPDFDQTARYGKWKIKRKGGKGQSIELYNLEEDPEQEQDIASMHPDIVAMFEEYLKTARTESPYWPEGE